MGNFIHLVRAEMLFAPKELSTFKNDKMNIVSNATREKIANLWLNMYNPF